ncbi:MAG: lipoyl synthase [Deltaproteobacteria bacterium]|nr:lipoyl synthase [Deltaproteobacteria bacterium]
MSTQTPKPPWFRRRLPAAGQSARVFELLSDLTLHTVCQEAHCPNQMECFGRGTATFLLLGPNCTRRCTFCAVEKNSVSPPNETEPERCAQAVARMKLNYCVLTMVTRDDLPDGGADHVARTICAVKEKCPDVELEVLISDFKGNQTALNTIIQARPDVLNHNVETVSRLYSKVRPQADYQRSLDILARANAAAPRPATKSGLMLGLGETLEEVAQVMDDLRASGCDLLTLGQYLSPSKNHHPVVEYIPPEIFDRLKELALEKGFIDAASGPYVRSSYQAEQLLKPA